MTIILEQDLINRRTLTILYWSTHKRIENCHCYRAVVSSWLILLRCILFMILTNWSFSFLHVDICMVNHNIRSKQKRGWGSQFTHSAVRRSWLKCSEPDLNSCTPWPETRTSKGLLGSEWTIFYSLYVIRFM